MISCHHVLYSMVWCVYFELWKNAIYLRLFHSDGQYVYNGQESAHINKRIQPTVPSVWASRIPFALCVDAESTF